MPRIAYWSSSFRPEMEAVAAEVRCLRNAFPGSVVWGISSRDWGRMSWRKGFSFHPRAHVAFRAITSVLQCSFDVNHIVGSLADWFHLKAITPNRPTVFSMAVSGASCDESLLDKIDRFAVEWPEARDELEKRGIASNRIQLVFPPVDLQRFRPTPAPDTPFTVMFASSPDRADWLEARGVDLILGAAELRPDIRFRLIWRPWGDSLQVVSRQIEQRCLGNVELVAGRVEDMSREYEQAHVVVAPFTQIENCKPAPNSIIEGLACGRPAIVTECVGLAEPISRNSAGVVTDASAEGLAESLNVARTNWNDLSKNACDMAARLFDKDRFVATYGKIYEEVL